MWIKCCSSRTPQTPIPPALLPFWPFNSISELVMMLLLILLWLLLIMVDFVATANCCCCCSVAMCGTIIFAQSPLLQLIMHSLVTFIFLALHFFFVIFSLFALLLHCYHSSVWLSSCPTLAFLFLPRLALRNC